MSRPRRILLCVVLRHAGPRYVVAVTRVAAGDFRGLRALHLASRSPFHADDRTRTRAFVLRTSRRLLLTTGDGA